MSAVRIYVFYAGLLHSEWPLFPRMRDLGNEVYNGAYVLVAAQVLSHPIWTPNGWYRADATPFPTDQVPPELRALALLLT